MPAPTARPYRDRQYTFPLNRTPLPAGAVTADRWHRKSEGYTRKFQSKAFRVFRGLTVQTAGAQVLMDGEPHPFTVRAITLSISGELVTGAPLWEHQARQFARALIAAADYIGEHSAVDGDLTAATAARWLAVDDLPAETTPHPLEVFRHRTTVPEVDEDRNLAEDDAWQIIQRAVDGSAWDDPDRSGM
jgi:hypothetical protein